MGWSEISSRFFLSVCFHLARDLGRILLAWAFLSAGKQSVQSDGVFVVFRSSSSGASLAPTFVSTRLSNDLSGFLFQDVRCTYGNAGKGRKTERGRGREGQENREDREKEKWRTGPGCADTD